jgi:hypothetical protein
MSNKNPKEYALGLLRLDDAAGETNGVFAVPIPEDAPMYNIRALDRYCKEKNIDPSNLTEEQLKQFEVK